MRRLLGEQLRLHPRRRAPAGRYSKTSGASTRASPHARTMTSGSASSPPVPAPHAYRAATRSNGKDRSHCRGSRSMFATRRLSTRKSPKTNAAPPTCARQPTKSGGNASLSRSAWKRPEAGRAGGAAQKLSAVRKRLAPATVWHRGVPRELRGALPQGFEEGVKRLAEHALDRLGAQLATVPLGEVPTASTRAEASRGSRRSR